MLYTQCASIVFSPKQIYRPELLELAASAVACYILLKQSKGIGKKNKDLLSEGRFQQSDLPFKETAERLQCVRLLFAPTARVKVKSDSALNPLWTSLTACVIWNAPLTLPPIQNFCHASQSGQLLMETMFFFPVCDREMVGSASGMGGFYLLDPASSASSRQESQWHGFCYWERFDGPVIITIMAWIFVNTLVAFGHNRGKITNTKWWEDSSLFVAPICKCYFLMWY